VWTAACCSWTLRSPGVPPLEVLTPGAANEKRDRETKLKLCSRRGVGEYWVVDWRLRRLEIFRRNVNCLPGSPSNPCNLCNPWLRTDTPLLPRHVIAI